MSSDSKDFVEFIVKSGVVKFGKFILKSGKISDIFFDFGQICYGSELMSLGEYYADFIVNNSLSDVNVLFGPAYKGINIAIATSIALFDKFGFMIPFTYNRKVQKNHAEGGNFIGYELSKAKSVLIVDDVFTDGGTKYETINLLSQFKHLSIRGIVVGVDRQEVNESGDFHISLFSKNTGIRVYALTTKKRVLAYGK